MLHPFNSAVQFPESVAPTSPTISVAICTHNGAPYIAEQVRSICQQTRLPFELVLSDDASGDGCVDIARNAHAQCVAEAPSRQMPALKVLQNSAALGITRNFEQAVRVCCGDVIALCDQDDVWRSDKLACLSSEFERRPDLVLLHTDAQLVDDALVPLPQSLFEALGVSTSEFAQIHEGQAFDVYLRRNLVTGATTAFRRPLLDDALPFPTEWLHDEWLAIIAAATSEADLLNAQLIQYRQHGSNQVGAQRITLGAKIRKALASRGQDPERRRVKAQVLLTRLLALGDKLPADRVAKARSKLEHQRLRAALPANRVARWFPIAREIRTGRYQAFDYGLEGVLRDLLEAE
ncbi:glycosyltransferase family 2 protein [Variovorax sp. J22R133]|uniref:glycosyltransferase family 2 protein n=1 Tax=Variovorax brevis TaxID=3053503 RepID=UPI002575E268|nr:glycosyltransferase family 2 protein [Variovorax sp. J22R133]MDM0114679.1 glycosyltransferase family 2 protein [Variovorax sp. J22R133]